MKKCPFCAEEIKDDAIKCRYCGEFLKRKWKGGFFGCLVAFTVTILLTILLLYLGFLVLKFIVFRIFFLDPGSGRCLPFTGGGIEGILREFFDLFKSFWERFKEYFQLNGYNYKTITF